MVIKIVLALGLVFTLRACATAQEGDSSAIRDEKKPLFYRGKNGVTVFCPAAKVGAKGIVDGVEYTKRDRSGLIDLASNKDTWHLLSTTCTSEVEDMSDLFSAIGFVDDFNVNIATWDTSSVQTMARMFRGAKSFNQPIGRWDTSNVQDMSSMFSDAKSFNRAIGRWDTSNVQNMFGMFLGAESFNQRIGRWDTGNVKLMFQMFFNAKSFNRPIGRWDTSNVQEMFQMFLGAESFNQRIGRWDTSNVLEMFEMFSGATSFNRDLSTWCVGKVSRFEDFALDSPLRKSFLPPFGTKDNCN